MADKIGQGRKGVLSGLDLESPVAQPPKPKFQTEEATEGEKTNMGLVPDSAVPVGDEEFDQDEIQETVKPKGRGREELLEKDSYQPFSTTLPESMIERMDRLLATKASVHQSKADIVRAGIEIILEEEEELVRAVIRARQKHKEKRAKKI